MGKVEKSMLSLIQVQGQNNAPKSNHIHAMQLQSYIHVNRKNAIDAIKVPAIQKCSNAMWSLIRPVATETGLVFEMLKVKAKVEARTWPRARRFSDLDDFLWPRELVIELCIARVYSLSSSQALSSTENREYWKRKATRPWL